VSHRIGVDIGGTFTDFALVDDASGEVSIHKRLTTPRDPAIAVLDGIAQLLAERAVPIGAVDSVIHGSTLVTNAVIERRGARTGMLVTEGFGDVLDIARESRFDLYDQRIRLPEPMVPRALRREVAERMRDDGMVLAAPAEAAVQRAVDELVAQGIESLAICFLHSFVNPANENAVRDIARRGHPGLHISVSSEVFPFIREYERWTTTAMNAFAQPMVDRYLGNIERGLAAMGFGGAFYVVSSSGGMVTPGTARRFPVRMLESGPAAGVLMSTHHGQRLGLTDILSFDMGGTTAKGSIVMGGVPRKVYELEVARMHEFLPGSGLPAKVPVLDMIEIGAGGGSIAGIDARGLIRVGPRSAGAEPGPACYGRGGMLPTLTDANVALGYFDPRFFLGGSMALDEAAAAAAIDRGVAAPLSLQTIRAAWGIHEIINEDVARAFRVHASEIGFDYRRCSMVAFGGSGPAHALRIARKLKIPRVILPVGAGVMSAFGMLVSPLAFQAARTRPVLVSELDAAGFAAEFHAVEEQARSFLRAAGIADAAMRIVRHLDMRYRGQGYEIEVELPAGVGLPALFAELPRIFADRYAAIFSLSYLEHPVELVNWKVEALGPQPMAAHELRLIGPGGGATAEKGTRRAWFPDPDGFVDCPVHDRYALAAGARIEGPALVEEREATLVLGRGDRATVDAHGNLVVEIGGGA
jgi:N-methylhydantoinase A